jgi:phosphoglycolate phosphatase
MVGDTLHDVEVAEALGISCVLIAQGHQSRERLDQAGVPVFADLNSFCRSL